MLVVALIRSDRPSFAFGPEIRAWFAGAAYSADMYASLEIPFERVGLSLKTETL